jgi:transposase
MGDHRTDAPADQGAGRIPRHRFRDVVDTILYIDRSGCSWRRLPVGSSPWQSVYGWFRQEKARGGTERVLREQIRVAANPSRRPDSAGLDARRAW